MVLSILLLYIIVYIILVDFMNKINSILQVLKQIVISPKHLFEVSKQIFNILSVLLSLFSDGLQQVIDGLGML